MKSGPYFSAVIFDFRLRMVYIYARSWRAITAEPTKEKPCMSIAIRHKIWLLQHVNKKWIPLRSILSSAAFRHVDHESHRDAGPVGLMPGGNWRAAIRQKYIHFSIPANIFYSISFPCFPPTRCSPVSLPVLAHSEAFLPNAFPQLLHLARNTPTGQQPS